MARANARGRPVGPRIRIPRPANPAAQATREHRQAKIPLQQAQRTGIEPGVMPARLAPGENGQAAGFKPGEPNRRCVIVYIPIHRNMSLAKMADNTTIHDGHAAAFISRGPGL